MRHLTKPGGIQPTNRASLRAFGLGTELHPWDADGHLVRSAGLGLDCGALDTRDEPSGLGPELSMRADGTGCLLHSGKSLK